MVKRWSHQMLVSKEIFAAHDLGKLKQENPKLARYMYHELGADDDDCVDLHPAEHDR